MSSGLRTRLILGNPARGFPRLLRSSREPDAYLRTPAHFRTMFKGSSRTRGVDDRAFRRPVVRSGGVAHPPAAPPPLAPFPVTESVAVPASLCPRTNAFKIGDGSRSRKQGFDPQLLSGPFRRGGGRSHGHEECVDGHEPAPERRKALGRES